MRKSEYGQYRRAAFGLGSPAAVTKWIAGGKIAAPALLADGRIDRALADAQLAGRLDPSRVPERPAAPPMPDDDEDDTDIDALPALPRDGSYSAAQIALANARRRKVELDIAEREGLLVDKAEAERVTFDLSRRLRDRLLSVPQKIAGRLVAITDERQAAALVRDAITEALNEIADDLDPAGGTGDAG